ncbi:hypothetical protein EVG20_g486 [Dentipellis fragilis]|uniref:Uncharacterized protein n=1 Tax=Dentipellis fragilis TaxID=205917 RepID=A0A4Y9ZCQ9_9AGAM|nr:hypothetical protein EVG20_g486 [Dentipellis fragilis]
MSPSHLQTKCSNSSSPTVSDTDSTTALIALSPSAPKSSSKRGFFTSFLQTSKHPYTYGFDLGLVLDAKQQKASSSPSSPPRSSTQEPDLVFGKLAVKYGHGAPSKSS